MSTKLDGIVGQAVQASRVNPSDNDELFQGLKGEDLARAKAQFALQKQQELVNFVSKMMRNDTDMQVINAFK